jgi:AcrR family transcriptional regulator
VTKPALYYHFKSKEAILLACVQDAFDRFQGLMQAQALSAASGRDRLCVFLKNYLVITTGNFGISLVLSEPHVLSPEGRKLYVRYRNSINRQLMQILTQGISDGSVRTGDPTLTSYAIFGMFNWAAKWSPDKPEISNDEIFEHFMSVILSGIDGDTRPEQEGPKSGAAP